MFFLSEKLQFVLAAHSVQGVAKKLQFLSEYVFY